MDQNITKEQILQAFETFRGKHGFHFALSEDQLTIIEAVINGNDALGVLPTGAGKSMCFILPPLLKSHIYGKPFTALVVSPLLALSSDQVKDLRQRGIAACMLESSSRPSDCNYLKGTLSYYRAENKPAVWLEISAQCGHVIPIAAEVGFSFHHAEKNHVMMYQWLDEGENRIPEFATHQVGVSGFVLDQQREQVLMVQDRHRIARWKFPGGYSKLGEDFSETAKREVFEETGIRTEFKSILAFRQQHQMPYSFNRSDIYVVCRLEPVTFDVTVCSTELLDAKWIPLKELFTSDVHTGLTLHVAGLARQGLEKGFQNVDIAMSELPSVYKGMTYKLFSRPSL